MKVAAGLRPIAAAFSGIRHALALVFDLLAILTVIVFPAVLYFGVYWEGGAQYGLMGRMIAVLMLFLAISALLRFRLKLPPRKR